jgi:hypothetical protein
MLKYSKITVCCGMWPDQVHFVEFSPFLSNLKVLPGFCFTNAILYNMIASILQQDHGVLHVNNLGKTFIIL